MKKEKKAKLTEAFGKVIYEKNLQDDLKAKLKDYLSKLNDSSTREYAFKELKIMVMKYNSIDQVKVILPMLISYASCSTVLGKEYQIVTIAYAIYAGFIKSADQLVVTRMMESIVPFLSENMLNIHKACSVAVIELYDLMVKNDNRIHATEVMLDFYLNVIEKNKAVVGQLKLNGIVNGASVIIDDLIGYIVNTCLSGKLAQEDCEGIDKVFIERIDKIIKISKMFKGENPHILEAISLLIQKLPYTSYEGSIKLLCQSLINILHMPDSGNYLAKIASCGIINHLGIRLNEKKIKVDYAQNIIDALNYAMKDRVLKVQVAASEALSHWNSDKIDYHEESNSESTPKTKMSKLNLLRNLSKIRKNKKTMMSSEEVRKEIFDVGIGKFLRTTSFIGNRQDNKLKKTKLRLSGELNEAGKESETLKQFISTGRSNQFKLGKKKKDTPIQMCCTKYPWGEENEDDNPDDNSNEVLKEKKANMIDFEVEEGEVGDQCENPGNDEQEEDQQDQENQDEDNNNNDAQQEGEEQEGEEQEVQEQDGEEQEVQEQDGEEQKAQEQDGEEQKAQEQEGENQEEEQQDNNKQENNEDEDQQNNNEEEEQVNEEDQQVYNNEEGEDLQNDKKENNPENRINNEYLIENDLNPTEEIINNKSKPNTITKKDSRNQSPLIQPIPNKITEVDDEEENLPQQDNQSQLPMNQIILEQDSADNHKIAQRPISKQSSIKTPKNNEFTPSNHQTKVKTLLKSMKSNTPKKGLKESKAHNNSQTNIHETQLDKVNQSSIKRNQTFSKLNTFNPDETTSFNLKQGQNTKNKMYRNDITPRPFPDSDNNNNEKGKVVKTTEKIHKQSNPKRSMTDNIISVQSPKSPMKSKTKTTSPLKQSNTKHKTEDNTIIKQNLIKSPQAIKTNLKSSPKTKESNKSIKGSPQPEVLSTTTQNNKQTIPFTQLKQTVFSSLNSMLDSFSSSIDNKLTLMNNRLNNLHNKLNTVILQKNDKNPNEKLKQDQENYQSIESKTQVDINDLDDALTNPLSCTLWKEIMSHIDKNDYDQAYQCAIDCGDDILFLRLILIVNSNLEVITNPSITKAVLIKMNSIFRCYMIQNTLIDMTTQFTHMGLFKDLSINEMNDLMQTMFDISKVDNTIGQKATCLYQQLRSEAKILLNK